MSDVIAGRRDLPLQIALSLATLLHYDVFETECLLLLVLKANRRAEVREHFSEIFAARLPLNDVRRVEMQQCHIRYLELAKRRLIDSLEDREFQALTLAIPRARLPEVKQALRDFVVALNERFSGLPDVDTVMQLECVAFLLTQPR